MINYRKIEFESKIPAWITKGFTSSTDIEMIEGFGFYIADAFFDNQQRLKNGKNEISSSQIRILYSELNRLAMKDKIDLTEILMIVPKVSYAAARKKSNTYDSFRDLVKKSIQIVVEKNEDIEVKKRFKNFHNLMEASLAYHKQFGGK